jgi:hypothetical protein
LKDEEDSDILSRFNMDDDKIIETLNDYKIIIKKETIDLN